MAYNKNSVTLGIDATTIQETLKSNEQRANTICYRIFISFLVLMAVSELLCRTKIFLAQEATSKMVYTAALPCLVAIVSYKVHAINSTVTKHILIACSIIIVVINDLFLTYNVSIVFVIPILISSLYFDEKLVIRSYITTIIAFGISTYLGATGIGLLDANHVELAKGTKLVIKTSLKDAIRENGYNLDMYIEKMMVLTFLPKVVVSVVLFILALALAKYGKEMLMKQAGITAKQTRISTELDVARSIQASALPKAEDLNGRYNFELAASMKAARETGGDFYDFTMLDDTHLALLVADVSDKGVPAAMFMMSAMARLNSSFNLYMSPGEILADVNNSLCENNDDDMFVTVWLGIIDLTSGVITTSNGGHDNPIFKLGDTGYVERRDKHGMLLGEFGGLKYPETELKMQAGDVLFLYTDGVNEAKSATGERFGMSRLVDTLNNKCSSSEMTAEDIRVIVTEEIKEFTQDAEQFDDMTMLVFKML